MVRNRYRRRGGYHREHHPDQSQRDERPAEARGFSISGCADHGGWGTACCSHAGPRPEPRPTSSIFLGSRLFAGISDGDCAVGSATGHFGNLKAAFRQRCTATGAAHGNPAAPTVPSAKSATTTNPTAPPAKTATPAPPATAPAPAASTAPGTLAVSAPIPVEIYKDDQHLGTTPVTLELPAGTHTLEFRFNLRKTGAYVAEQASVRPEPGSNSP